MFRSFLLNDSQYFKTLFLFSETTVEEEKFLPTLPWGARQRGREMKRVHQSILGLISCYTCLVPLQFLLCPRFPNRNALVLPVMWAPRLKVLPGDAHACVAAQPLSEGGRSQVFRHCGAQFGHGWSDSPHFTGTRPSWSTDTTSKREVHGVTSLVQQENWIQINISSNAVREQAWHIITAFLSGLLQKEYPSMVSWATSVYSESYPWGICTFALCCWVGFHEYKRSYWLLWASF